MRIASSATGPPAVAASSLDLGKMKCHVQLQCMHKAF